MTANRTSQTVLILICIALWGLLLRPLFSPTQARAQAPSTTVTQLPASESPTVIEPRFDAPYMVVSNGQISLWAVHPDQAKEPMGIETDRAKGQESLRNYVNSSRLVRLDVQPLPGR